MDKQETYSLLIAKIKKDFILADEKLPDVSDYNFIKEYLTEKIKELMSKDFDRFIINLYRIDVSEDKVHEILHSKDKASIPEKLAELIIERQLLRIKTQLMYKRGEL
ncbi:MAG: hypothetical protein N2249_00030 [Melioribacter sp.]|nr:hypothetical protein [Melioribacter sp.]